MQDEEIVVIFERPWYCLEQSKKFKINIKDDIRAKQEKLNKVYREILNSLSIYGEYRIKII